MTGRTITWCNTRPTRVAILYLTVIFYRRRAERQLFSQPPPPRAVVRRAFFAPIFLIVCVVGDCWCSVIAVRRRNNAAQSASLANRARVSRLKPFSIILPPFVTSRARGNKSHPSRQFTQVTFYTLSHHPGKNTDWSQHHRAAPSLFLSFWPPRCERRFVPSCYTTIRKLD
jgi:hypothetical protein